jgi:hypothetical protein
MGFLKTAFHILQDLISVGGTYRMRKQCSRYSQLRDAYDRLRDQISQVNAAILAGKAGVHNLVNLATCHLRNANSILTPVGNRVNHELFEVTKQKSLPHTASLLGPRQEGFTAVDTSFTTVVAAGAGVGTVSGSWGAVQMLGHASTGAAMAQLHGAAAANAGWAWFGGGSLATGGGGIAVGQFILPGIGTAVAVAISATLSHREANRTADLCCELETVNRENSSVLSKVQSELNTVNRMQAKLKNEDLLLCDATRATLLKVRRFGWISHLRRLLRYWIKGYYYSQEEFVFVARLDAAVLRFVAAFKTVEA